MGNVPWRLHRWSGDTGSLASAIVAATTAPGPDVVALGAGCTYCSRSRTTTGKGPMRCHRSPATGKLRRRPQRRPGTRWPLRCRVPTVPDRIRASRRWPARGVRVPLPLAVGVRCTDGPCPGRWLGERRAAIAALTRSAGASVSFQTRASSAGAQVGDLQSACSGAVLDHRRSQDRDAKSTRGEVGDGAGSAGLQCRLLPHARAPRSHGRRPCGCPCPRVGRPPGGRDSARVTRFGA